MFRKYQILVSQLGGIIASDDYLREKQQALEYQEKKTQAQSNGLKGWVKTPPFIINKG